MPVLTLKRRFQAFLAAAFLSALGLNAAQAGEYALTIDEVPVNYSGKERTAYGINGTVPAPTLRFKEGETVVIRVTNNLDAPSSIHWHGLILPGEMDGVPGFNGYKEIPPGETFTYQFTLEQAGTYWYHSHSSYQEQRGIYGPMIVDPAGEDPVAYDREHIIMLSDWTDEEPADVHANLKANSDYYNRAQRTIGDFFSDSEEKGLGAAVENRMMWGEMRMMPTDIADVSGYRFLTNGRTAEAPWSGNFRPGEKVRLRFINGSAMTFFDVRIPGLKMTVVQADGQNVEPVPVDEFRIAVAETYDVIVTPEEARSYTIVAEPIDRTGFALSALAADGVEPEVVTPAQRPRSLLTMADMGMAHGGMDHGAMDHGAMDGGMDHGSMNQGGDHGDMDHSSMGHETMDHSAMDHGTMDHGTMDHGAMDHGAMDHGAMEHGAMEHGAMEHGGGLPSNDVLSPPVGAPPGAKVLGYADLRALEPHESAREPEREIIVRLGGNMERYIWTINGKKFSEAGPINLRYGERVKLTFVNETMMNHPMHLHGMFVELENGQPLEKQPLKHVVNVGPGRSYSVHLDASEAGEWAFHCHLLYHMASGMMRKVVVAKLAADAMPAVSEETVQ